MLSDRVYLAMTVIVPDAGHHRALPVDPVRPRHPGRRGIRDRRVRQRHLARPHRAVELDARRRRRGRGRDPHRAVVAGGAEHLHAVRGAGARRRHRRAVPAPDPHGGRRDRHRHDPGLADLPLRASTTWMPQSGVGEIVPADRHARRAARHRPRGSRARHVAAHATSGARRGRGRTAADRRRASSSGRSRCSSPAARRGPR